VVLNLRADGAGREPLGIILVRLSHPTPIARVVALQKLRRLDGFNPHSVAAQENERLGSEVQIAGDDKVTRTIPMNQVRAIEYDGTVTTEAPSASTTTKPEPPPAGTTGRNRFAARVPLARSQPRHLAPQPKALNSSPRGGLDGVIDSLLFAQHAIEMFRRSLPNGTPKHRLDRLANRLTKILAEVRKLNPAG
jgi:hypothetical protein